MKLPAPARCFSALIQLDQNYGSRERKSGEEEGKRVQVVSQPPQNEHVANPHGNGRQNDDEKGTVHNLKSRKFQPAWFVP
jgi:hypothetical protein